MRLDSHVRLSRRHFLGVSLASGALTAALIAQPALAAGDASAVDPTAFVRINSDNSLTIRINRPEMGQGTMTSMAMLIAEELDADWSRVAVEWAPVLDEFNQAPLAYQVGGSSAVRDTFLPLRRLGAGLRLMLTGAAARRWSVAPEACRTEAGHVLHPDGRQRLPYAALAGDVRTSDVPAEVPLKDSKSFRLLGQRVAEPLTPSKVDGSATYGIDADVSGMLVGLVVRPPTSTGKLRTLDADAVRALPGVRWIGEIRGGVGIVATSFWRARKAREALKVEWDDGIAAQWSSPGIAERQQAALDSEPTLLPIGDAALADEIARAPKRLSQIYSVPFQAHAALEPLNCTAHVRADGADVWLPTQNPMFVRGFVARELKLDPSAVTVHPLLMGGSFGRKYTPEYFLDAVHLSKAAGAPVKAIWLREDDMAHSPYRPAATARLTASLDERGRPAAWDVRIAGPSFNIRSERSIEGIKTRSHGVDDSFVEGLCPPQYPVPRTRVVQHWVDVNVPVMWWRSVAHSYTAFFVESFIDELAHAAKRDPLDYRLDLLRSGAPFPPSNKPEAMPAPEFDPARMAAVLEAVQARSSWGRKLPKGQGLGVAGHFSFGSYVAQVAAVRASGDSIRVTDVWTVVDCGQIVHPGIIEQQVQGSIVFALGATLKSAITIDKGRTVQSNYHDFEVMQLAETPRMDVHILPSAAKPGGIGEPAVPPVAPAVANALFAATGKRIRSLPFVSQGITLA